MKIYHILLLSILLSILATHAGAQTMSSYAYDTSKIDIYYPMSRDTFNVFKDSLTVDGKIVRYTGYTRNVVVIVQAMN